MHVVFGGAADGASRVKVVKEEGEVEPDVGLHAHDDTHDHVAGIQRVNNVWCR